MKLGYVIAAVAAALTFSAPVSAQDFQLSANDLTPDGNGNLIYQPDIQQDQKLVFSWSDATLINGSVSYDITIFRNTWFQYQDGSFELFPDDGPFPTASCDLILGNHCFVPGSFDTTIPHLLDIYVGANSVSIVLRKSVRFGTCDIATAAKGLTCMTSVGATNVTALLKFENAPDLRIDGTRLSLDGLPVPEPSSWAMLMIGFGLVGAAMRSPARRRRQTVRA